MVALFSRSVAATVLFFAALALWPAAEPDHVGPARVIDGDTIVVAGETHRLFGIDAVEREQTCRTREGATWPCGHEAAAALRRFLAGRTVGCEERGHDDDGCHVSLCYAGKDNLSAWLAREGWAVADRKSPRLLNYTSDEHMARFLGKGIWSGSFETPEDWRRARR